MKSITLSIYNTEMSPQKNFVVEDVETYLSKLITKTYENENFQVPKISLNMTIKINVSQDNVFKQIGNYVRMLCDSRKYYFFIIGSEWKSSNAVELRLYMDTLNTFYYIFKNSFSEKTLITRQHQDRWLPNQKLGSLLMPKVNEISEGLEGLPLYKRDDVILGQQSRDERLNQPWFLVYKTAENPSSYTPIQILLYPENKVPMLYKEATENKPAETIYSKKFSDVDRTDSKLMKIIELPCCPANLEWDEKGNCTNVHAGRIIIDAANGLFDVDTSVEFIRNDIEDIALPTCVPFEPTNYANKNMVRYVSDPKLYHSSFSLFKLVYDSYSLPIAMERAHYSKPTAKFTLEMKASNSIQSNLVFHFVTTDINYIDNADYSLYLVSTRNNEVPIYNNAYIDYLRNGYNFDRKSQTREAALTWTTTALSLVGSAASFALTPVTGGLSAVAGVGLLTSSVASIGRAITATVQNESNIQKTLEQTKSQATNVSGVDDLDLLKYYGKNKAHFMKYTVSENMKKKLNDLFYYCGYAYQNYGKPDLNSRLWFNFVQCDPVFQRTGVYNEYLDDISAHFKLGVTIFHHDENGNYDLKQTKENWEVSLL